MKTTAKNSAFIIGYFMLAGALGIIAAVPVKVEKAAKENVRREIMKNIVCPAYVQDNTAANDVKAMVSVNDQGKVSLHEINSANIRLRNYVEDVLENMTVKNTRAIEKFILTVKFRVE
jgi:hypothetical protein